jgi:uncharacterized membrane protein YgcG
MFELSGLDTFDPNWVNPRSGIALESFLSSFIRRLLPASALAMAFALVLPAGSASAAQASVGLGTAAPYAVLAGTTVTNTGPSTISGSVGVAPGSAVVGFPPGLVSNGSIHAADAEALQAQDDLTTAYNDAAGRGPVVDQTGQNLGGQTLTPGVYSASTSMNLTGTVTLDALGDPAAVFIFQAGSTLLTASSSRVALIGAAQPCNVFWQVGSSATIGTGTTFVGTVMALTSITLQTGATVQGRMLARNGQVALDNNTFVRPACDLTVPSPAPSPTATASPSSSPSATPSDWSTEDSGGNNDGDANTGGDNGGSNGGSNNAGSSGGGSGSGTSGGGGPTPYIPTGHPETGRPTENQSTSLAWLGLGGLCLAGAGVAARRAHKAHTARQSR